MLFGVMTFSLVMVAWTLREMPVFGSMPAPYGYIATLVTCILCLLLVGISAVSFRSTSGRRVLLLCLALGLSTPIFGDGATAFQRATSVSMRAYLSVWDRMMEGIPPSRPDRDA